MPIPTHQLICLSVCLETGFLWLALDVLELIRLASSSEIYLSVPPKYKDQRHAPSHLDRSQDSNSKTLYQFILSSMKTRTLIWKGGLGSRVCVCMYVFDMRISLCSPGCLESPGDPFVSAYWVLEDQDHRLRPHTSHLVYCLGKGLGGLVTWLSNTPLWSLGISVRLSNLLNKCLLPLQPL